MANMSYCRFHNTLEDLRDCLGAIDDGANISGSEMRKAERLFQLVGCWLQDIGAVEEYDHKALMTHLRESQGVEDDGE